MARYATRKALSIRRNLLRFLAGVCISIALPTLSASEKAHAGCFRDHLSEAIAINLEREPIYQQLSNYRSTEISNRLISGERLAKFASYLFYNFDAEAEKFQAQGIQIVCDEFIPMSNTPTFRAVSEGASLDKFEPLDYIQIQRDLRRALRVGFGAVHETAKRWIGQIEHAEPRFNCMTRHVLESVARIALLAPGHMAKAKALGLSTTEDLSRRMISSHFMLFQSSAAIDALAAPLQAEGIAIICQDVPPIPY